MKKSFLLITLIGLNLGVYAQNDHEIIRVRETASSTRAHIIVGNPTTTPSQPSSMITFAGWGIQHAGFVWNPDIQSKGKLNLAFGANDNGSFNSTKFTFQANGNFGIGTQNPDEKLTVKGKIHAEEVRVDLNVPADYVFQHYYTGASLLKDTYKMPTLEEVAAFTKKNHHLPEIPSAEQIQKEGLHLKQMTNLLLQKIEELTLYTIEQEKRIKALENQLIKKK